MSLSKLALRILKDPMHWLHVDRVYGGEELQVAIAHPDYIYQYAKFSPSSTTSIDFRKALSEIRTISSQRGQHPGKSLIHNSIEHYAKLICNKFKSLNQMNVQIKTVYGSELPVRFREQFHSYFKDRENHPYSRQEVYALGEPVESEPVESQPEDHPLENNLVSLNLEGLSFTLSKGASLTIGQLTTKTLDFKGLKSVSIDKVEGGCLYGVSLEA